MPKKAKIKLTQRKGTNILGKTTKKSQSSQVASQVAHPSSFGSISRKRSRSSSFSDNGILSLRRRVSTEMSEHGILQSGETPRRSKRIQSQTLLTSTPAVQNELIQSLSVHCSQDGVAESSHLRDATLEDDGRNKIFKRRSSLDDSSASDSESQRPKQIVISAMVHHIQPPLSQQSNNIEINRSPELHATFMPPAPVHDTIIRRMSLDDSSDEELLPVFHNVIEVAIIHDNTTITKNPVAPNTLLHQHSPGGRITSAATYDEIQIDLPGEYIDAIQPAEPVNEIPIAIDVPHNIDVEEEVVLLRDDVELERRRRRFPTLLLAIQRTIPNNHPTSYLGPLNSQCNHCEALHFRREMTTRHEFSTCCHKGKVALPVLQPMPDLLDSLFRGQHPQSKHFRDNILQYNYAFQFASLQATLRDLPPNRRAPYVYAIQGKIIHQISNVNINNQHQRYGPVYYLNPEQAVNARMHINTNLNVNLVRNIDILLREINPYARAYMHLRERYEQEMATIAELRENNAVPEPLPMPTVVLELLSVRGRNNREYDLPVVDEVAAIYRVHADAPPTPNIRIYVRDHPDRYETVHYTNETLQPLTFPLLFPRGDTGWHIGMPHANNIRGNVSLCEYYAYRLALRRQETRFLYAHRLSQQYVVSAYIDIESSRLDFIRNNQDRLRADQYIGLADYLHRRAMQNNNDDEAAHLGKMVILPSSFIGSPRAQQQNFQDAMAVVCKYGHPSLFITMTMNPKWQEVTENIPRGHQPNDHPLLLSRVFKCKWELLLNDLLQLKVFGEPAANLSVIEFQKRGLPHSHDLLILKNEDRILDAQQIDQLICAEIPDPINEAELYEIVSKNMVHNPCDRNPNAVCLIDGVCSKGFPKPFCNGTIIQENGRIIYRRRNNGRTITITYNGIRYEMDNRWIVPYNAYCLLQYNCHINVEACVTANSVKYLYKYFFKGTDHALVRIAADFGNAPEYHYNEIESFLNGRYLAPIEASWHVLQFPMIKKTHSVFRLCVHLPERQVVRFQPGNEIEALQRNEFTHLTGWFLLNQEDENARQYLYTEIPLHYVWKSVDRCWVRRQRGSEKVIPRMYSINVRNQELYSLRTLLLHQRGATGFEDLRTVDGHVCDTFLQACQMLNLMADDAEWRRALLEASERDMPYQLRCMFSYMLIFCEITDKLALWEEFRPHFIEDFIRRGIDDDNATQRCLAQIQSILVMNGTRLSDFGLPEPRIADVDDAPHIDLQDVRLVGAELRAQLNAEQSAIFEAVHEAVHNDVQPHRLFFVNAAAGAGKSFLFQALLAVFQGEEIATIACAPTGIAAMLLQGGRTLHSRFRLPLEINETTTSSVTQNSEAGRLIIAARLIVLDEVSMITRSIFKVVERAIRDLCNDNRPFANKVVIVAGDFRQTLPVIPAGFRETIVDECVRGTLDRLNFSKHDLLINMRARADQQQFSQWLLELGNGTLASLRRSHYGSLIQLPPQCLANSKDDLIQFCLGNLDFNFVSNKVILTPLNVTCQAINDDVIDRLHGPHKFYLSSDSIEDADRPDIEYANYSIEFLNSLQPSGFPPHRLKLKVGCIVVLLRNLNLKNGLCNGTRLLVHILGNRYIDAEKMDHSGHLTGQRVFIPRIDLIAGNTTLPFKLKRRQFPIKLAYAMTVNKSQGQTYDTVGIYLPTPVFSHGQLYVAFSRARGFDKVKIFVEETVIQGKLNIRQPGAVYTRNVVYREVL